MIELSVIDAIEKRLRLLEKVFGKLMQFDMRLDTLEFNANLPVKPSISEKLLDLQLRLEKLEHVNQKEDIHE